MAEEEKKKKKNIKNRGFTLVEVLATIFVISIVLGIGGSLVISTINKSQEQKLVLTHNNVKTTARLYVEENPNDVIWTETEKDFYSCVQIKTLINKNFLEQSVTKKSNLKNTDYVIVTKDQVGTIISEKLDNSNTCNTTLNNIATIPTKKNCNGVEYSGSKQNLASLKGDDKGFSFKEETNTGVDAGNYKVTANLDDGYTWSDGSTEDKTITCSIKKAMPTLTLIPPGTDSSNITDDPIYTTLVSNVSGKIKIKSSNKNYVVASANNNGIEQNVDKLIEIKPLSTRYVDTVITITIIPNDTKNYYSNSTNYTIGNINYKLVDIPTSEVYCADVSYDNTKKVLTKSPGEGYNFYNNTGTEFGKYTITARLKFGYIWNSGKENDFEDKTFECEIKHAAVMVTYNTNGGTICNPTNKKVIYNQKYGTLCTTTKPGYVFNGWFLGAKEITEDSIVSTYDEHSLLARWAGITYNVKYDCNGGSGSMDNSFHIYNVAKKLSTNTCKLDNSSFAGWNTEPDGSGTSYANGESVKNLTTKSKDVVTLYAQWESSKYNVTFNPNGGAVTTTSKSVTNGATYGTLPTPTRNHTVTYNANGTGATIGATSDTATYTFDGWYTSLTGGTKITSSSTVNLTANQTLYAHWTSKNITLTTINKSGYTCTWNTSSDGNGTSYNQETSYTPIKDITLYAICKSNTYKVTFDPNGGDVSTTSKSVTNGATYDALPTPTRSYTVTYNANGTSATIGATSDTATYTFDGWYTSLTGGTKITSSSTVNLTANQTLYAHWTSKNITLTTITKSGNICTWNTSSDGNGTSYNQETNYTPIKDITLYAICKPNSYTVNFYPSGGDVTPASKSVTNGSTYGTLPTPTKSYTVTYNANGTSATIGATSDTATYTFNGWYTTSTGGSQITSSSIVKLTTNQTLYAHWAKKSITLTTITKSSNTCTWNTASGGEGTSYNPGDSFTPTENITLYAICNAKTHTVNFDANGGYVTPASKSVTNGSTYGTLPTPTRSYTVTYNANGTGATLGATSSTAAYTFDGWYTTSTGGSKITSSSLVNIISTQTLYAHWTSKSVTLPTITKTGNTCTWNTASGGGGTSYNQGTSYTPTKHITLYAICKTNPYTVKFDANGGNVTTTSKSVTNGSTYGTLPTPTRSYTVTYSANNTGATIGATSATATYTFNGWYTTSTGGSQITSSSVVNLTANQTLYAHWTNKSVTLTSITKTGYTCTWNTASGGGGTSYNPGNSYTPTKGITLYAICKANKYTVTFNPNGGSVLTNSKTVTYNSTYGELPIPSRTNYNFEGWYTALSGGSKITSSSKVSITANQTLYARWTLACSEDSPTACTKLYTCRYGDNDGTKTTTTWVHAGPTTNTTSVQAMTVSTGALVYKLGEVGDFYYVYVDDNVKLGDTKYWFEEGYGRKGYIKKSCLSSGDPLKDKKYMCSIDQCPSS